MKMGKLNSTSYRKAEEQRLNLRECEDFQNDIVRLRVKWNIPKDGFKSSEKLGKWEKWLRTFSWEKAQSPEHLKKLIDLGEREKVFNEDSNNNASVYQKIQQDYRKLNLAIPVNEFHNDIVNLRVKYKLSDVWESELRSYLLSNVGSGLIGPYCELRYNKDTNEPELWLRIHGDTTLKEIKDVWREVKACQGKLVGYKKRFRGKCYRDRDNRIFKLYKEGKGYPEIEKISREDGYPIDRFYIAKIIEREKRGRRI